MKTKHKLYLHPVNLTKVNKLTEENYELDVVSFVETTKDYCFLFINFVKLSQFK